MRSNYIILGIILIICTSFFFVGCSNEENKELSYEMISFENAPKEVQDMMMLSENHNKNFNEDYNSGGGVDLGKERYEFFITNEGETPKILEIGPDETYGRGIMIKYTIENKENAKFPDTSTIIKLNEYYGEITRTYISHP